MRELTALLVFVFGVAIGWSLHEGKSVHECSVYSEWDQSPHEQQDDPQLVSTPKPPEDERFIF